MRIITIIIFVLLINVPAFGWWFFRIIDHLFSFFDFSFWPNSKERINSAIIDFYSSTRSIQKNFVSIFGVYFCSTIRWLLEGYVIVFLSLSLSLPSLSLIEALGVISVAMVVGMITVTPAGIGGGTLSSALMLELIGLSSSEAGALTILNTFLGPVFVILLAVICFPYSRLSLE